MRLLVVTEEVWNDKLYPNNVMTNWLEDFDGQIANLYLDKGMPDNPCCSEYFQITDKMALCNLVRRKGGGKWFITNRSDAPEESPSIPVGQTSGLLKMIRRAFPGVLHLLRDAVWLRAKWERSQLVDFLKAYQPELIFSFRFSSRRMLSMERLLHRLTGAPIIAFTGDDEYSLKQLKASPFYWIRRLLLRRDIRKTSVYYGKYYTLSQRQAREFAEVLGVNSGVLYKGGNFVKLQRNKKLSKPIRIIYAGRLYCNRDKTLLALAKALKRINRDEVQMTLEIYTKDNPGARVRNALNDERSVFLKGFVTAKELGRIYNEGDIVLHVEGFDLKNRLLTRYSFSTKIVDCLASNCAVLAIGPYENEGVRYLKKNHGAICIGKVEEIDRVLSHILTHPDKIELYRRNAWNLGAKAHRKEVIRQGLYEDMKAIVKGDSEKPNAGNNDAGNSM